MATKKKMLQAAAGNAGGAGLDVEEVFSTYLYTSTGSSFSVNNGIDLAGEGGLVWTKGRDSTRTHWLYDTERGTTKGLVSSQTNAEFSVSNAITSFNSDGYTLGTYDEVNSVDSKNQVSWTFRKAPKFFDVVTYTGDGVAGRTVSHNLGTTPGFILVKNTSSSDYWAAYHTSLGADYSLRLNENFAAVESSGYVWGSGAGGSVEPTSTNFTVHDDGAVNGNGSTYVAYLFAHNDGDGEFGADSDADIIKCGSVVADGSGNATVDLGFEPQWLMVKNATSSGYDWQIFDTMRGFKASPDNDSPALFANTSGAESGQGDPNITSTGFTWDGGGAAPNNTYIFIAIRRGTKVPESGTEVFAIDTANGTSPSPPHFNSGFPVDFEFNRDVASAADWYAGSRLTGTKFLRTNTTDAEQNDSSLLFDYQNGFYNASYTFNTAYSWMWKRAPGYFDVVAEPIASAQMSGPASSSYNPAHNLGVTPEMIWVKDRDNTDDWYVYHSALGTSKKLILNSTAAESSSSWAVASDNFNFYAFGNATGNAICYLFASLPNVSKCGSYTGNGGTQTIDCGFTSGAKFVIVKATDGGNWFVFDTDRGITSSGSESLRLNLTTAELSVSNAISPDSSGFIVEASLFNNSGDTYIFYAIA